MSLNRCEQRIYDYLQSHAEEHRFWHEKVRRTVASAGEGDAAVRIESELWRYYDERSAVASPFKEAAAAEGRQRTSMRNLTELLIRLWTDPRPTRSHPASEGV